MFLPDEDRTVSIAAEHLQPVQPTRGTKVKVILGEDRDSTGLLLSIDSQEGVVKLDQNGDVKMLQLKYFCKNTIRFSILIPKICCVFDITCQRAYG